MQRVRLAESKQQLLQSEERMSVRSRRTRASLGVVVVTNNEKDFDGIPGLEVENWTTPPEGT